MGGLNGRVLEVAPMLRLLVDVVVRSAVATSAASFRAFCAGEEASHHDERRRLDDAWRGRMSRDDGADDGRYGYGRPVAWPAIRVRSAALGPRPSPAVPRRSAPARRGTAVGSLPSRRTD